MRTMHSCPFAAFRAGVDFGRDWRIRFALGLMVVAFSGVLRVGMGERERVMRRPRLSLSTGAN
jgi:hypothetical protein